MKPQAGKFPACFFVQNKCCPIKYKIMVANAIKLW